MPKVDDTHLSSRIIKRIEELERGVEVPAKDINAVLSKAQQVELDAAWREQQELRKSKRARTKEEQEQLGWKSKREVRLEVLRNALAEAKRGSVDAFKQKQQAALVRQARIYFDSLNASEAKGITGQQAKDIANNELTRAGLRRMDDQIVRHRNRRDREIEEMEAELQRRFEQNMTEEERAQLELQREIETWQGKTRK